MSLYNLHFLNARNDLTPVMSEIRAATRAGVAAASDRVDLPPFDLILRAGDDEARWLEAEYMISRARATLGRRRSDLSLLERAFNGLNRVSQARMAFTTSCPRMPGISTSSAIRSYGLPMP